MPASRPNGRSNRNTVTSMSTRLHTTTSERAQSGRILHIRSSLTAVRITLAKEAEALKEAERRKAMSRQERCDLNNLRDIPDTFDDDDWEDDVLHGRAAAQISHAGESLPEDPERADADLFQGLCNTGYAEAAKAKRGIETQRRHALEVQVKVLATVQDLEVRLDVMRRWLPEDEKWAEVSVMVRRRRYQHALDHLQGLIISRIFELAKCNMSDTGYKLRKHIAKALQARSKAVKNGITRYNEVAQTMTPPKPTLDWEEVVEYAFLADFDLLREEREDIRGELWAQPAGRAAMDQHYKLLRADEEIQRLNVEIRRLVTYMVDKAVFLAAEEGRLREEGEEALAVQVGLLRMERVRFTAVHMSRLTKLSKDPGFTDDLVPGVSVSRERHTPVARHARDRDVDMRAPSPPPQQEENGGDGDEEEEVESDDDDGELAEAFMNIVRIAHDDTIEAEDI
ncbi:hypothetical protein B0H19DRAFT_1374151 [Mycena capillaripes]|nr:hypothetical protein B0H19DRAFT_1374151 [Mycena capillaripes]